MSQESPSSFDSGQLLQQLTGDTQAAVGKLEARASAGVDLEARFSEIEAQIEEAAKIKDQEKRDLRMKVLTADLEELRRDADQEAQDLAQAVFGLNAMLEGMGDEYAHLNELSEEEKGLIAAAEGKLEAAEAGLRAAQAKWFFKAKAVAQSEMEIIEAKTGIEEARSEARRRARRRLLKANMEASLQEFMLRVEKTISIMERRKEEIEQQLAKVTAKKASAFEVKEEAAKVLEKLDVELNEAEDRLRLEEDHLETLENGTPAHAEQTRKVSDLRAEVEELRGRRNTAFVLFQSKEKFAAELEVHERTQMKLRDNQRAWITALRSDTEERVVTFRSRLEAMKAMSDQEIAKDLDKLGAAADQKNVEYMVRAGAVSDEIRMKRMEDHPERIAKIAAARAAQAEAIQRIRQREHKMIEQFKELYGIDPTRSSFFSYEDGSGATNDDSSEPTGTF